MGFSLDFFTFTEYIHDHILYVQYDLYEKMAHIKLISNARSHISANPPPIPLRISIDQACSLLGHIITHIFAYSILYTIYTFYRSRGWFRLRWTRSVRNPENERRTRVSEMSPRLTGSMHVCARTVRNKYLKFCAVQGRIFMLVRGSVV